MKPTAIFIDIDATLTTHRKPRFVSKENIEALKNAQKEGIHIVLATGRDQKGLMIIHDQIKFNEFSRFLIYSSGAVVEDIEQKKTFLEKRIEQGIASEVIDFVQKQGHFIKFPLDDHFYIRKQSYKSWLMRFVFRSRFKKYHEIKPIDQLNLSKIGVGVTSKGKVVSVSEELVKKFPNLEIAMTGSQFYIELTSQGVTKASAAKLLADEMGWDLQNCVAIGDSMNDYELFKVVGYPIAMGNAMIKLKHISKHITTSAKKNGVANAISFLKTLG